MNDQNQTEQDQAWKKVLGAARAVPPFSASQEERLFARIAAGREGAAPPRFRSGRRSRLRFWCAQAALWALVFSTGYLIGQLRGRSAAGQPSPSLQGLEVFGNAPPLTIADDDGQPAGFGRFADRRPIREVTVSSDDEVLRPRLVPRS